MKRLSVVLVSAILLIVPTRGLPGDLDKEPQVVTPTWFSMFLQDGSRFSPVEYMTYAWKGRWPDNRAPEIRPIVSPADSKKLVRGATYEAYVEATDPDGDPLTYRWQIMSESKSKKKDGTWATRMRPVSEGIVTTEVNRVTFRASSQPGAYRLLVYLRDGKGNAASVNFPFFVP